MDRELKGEKVNIGALLKMAKGATDPDVLKAALGAMGFDLEMAPVSLEDAPGALRQLATQAGRRGAQLHRLSGTMKDGGGMEAFIVLIPPKQVIAQTSPQALPSPA